MNRLKNHLGRSANYMLKLMYRHLLSQIRKYETLLIG